jgi:hypothetical protein
MDFLAVFGGCCKRKKLATTEVAAIVLQKVSDSLHRVAASAMVSGFVAYVTFHYRLIEINGDCGCCCDCFAAVFRDFCE